MAWSIHPKPDETPWQLAERQHGVVARAQLAALGLSARAVEWRIAEGRLHLVHHGVYAVGRPKLTRFGRWMAAVLSCGPHAMLSHEDAGAIHRFGGAEGPVVQVSVVASSARRRPGIRIHRRPGLDPNDVVTRHGIPVTSPVQTFSTSPPDWTCPTSSAASTRRTSSA